LKDIFINSSSLKQICIHLNECDLEFVPPLSTRVNVGDYSKKIYNKATRFEFFDSDKLVGLIAAYIDNRDSNTGFITNVSVNKDYWGLGVGGALLKACINFFREKGVASINLEVNENNLTAVNLYANHGFVIDKNHRNILILSKLL